MPATFCTIFAWTCITARATEPSARSGQRLKITRQCVWQLLSNHGRSETAPGIVACCLCGQPIIRGGDALRNNGPVACLDCLRDRPQLPFGVRLKAFRMAAGWTQKGLARRARIPLTTSRDYECGDAQAKWPNLVKLVKALGGGLVTLAMGQDGLGSVQTGQAQRERLPNKPR